MYMKDFIKKWSIFLGIMLSPGSTIPLLLAMVCLYFALTKPDTSISILLSIIASILTAIAGFFIKDDWDKIRGDSLLEKKGKSAIRNLSSIGQQITQIENWVQFFINKKQVTKRELEEINRHLGTIEINIKSGLEDWIDIVPELKEDTEFVKNYEDLIRGYIDEILKNKKELLIVGENEELKEKLEKRIKELENNVRGLKKERSGIMLSSMESPSNIIVGNSLAYNIANKTCSICGNLYYDDSGTLLTSSIYNNNICPNCRKNMI